MRRSRIGFHKTSHKAPYRLHPENPPMLLHKATGANYIRGIYPEPSAPLNTFSATTPDT